MADKVERLAAALAEAWKTGGTIPLPGEDDRPKTRAQAFAVQDRMAALIGGRVAGWKVGATAPAVQRLEGHDGPIPGRLFAERVFDSPARVPADLFPRVKVECEFAFRLTKDLPLRGRPSTAAELADAIDLRLAVELTGTRYAVAAGSRRPGSWDGIADNGGGNGFVLGPPIATWSGTPFATLAIDTRIDGAMPIEVYIGDYRRDPVVVLAEVVNDLAARGIALAAGDTVSTGSLTLPTPIARGQTLIARFEELGEVQVELD